MTPKICRAWLVAIALVGISTVAEAQVHLGNNLVIRGSGTASAGYAADSGDQIKSLRGFNFGFGGEFSGFYFDPKFIAFQLRPYYSQSRANSDYQSLSDSSGILASSNIFNGSHFPGAISFSKTYTGLSTTGNQNGADLASSGTGRGIAISWSALIPNKPTFTVGYSTGGGSGEILGSKQANSNNNQNLNFRTGYKWRGYHMNGGYQIGKQNSQSSGFLIGQAEIESSAKHDDITYALSHALPLHGSFYSNLQRTHFESFYQGVSGGRQTMDYINAGVTLAPLPKISLSFNGSYSDNLSASYNQLLTGNGIGPNVNLGDGSYSTSLSGGVGYTICKALTAFANVTHLGQSYSGGSHQTTYFNASINGNYQRPLFGMLTWSIGGADNANQEGNSNFGFSTAANLTRRINAWTISGGVDYQQNSQTLLAGWTTSQYRWMAQTTHKFSQGWYWNGALNGSQSVIVQEAGSGNNSQSASSGVGNGRFSFAGNYSQSKGRSILTSQGLQSVTVPLPIVPVTSLVLFDATSYGFSASAHPRRALTLQASYSKAMSNTSSTQVNSKNDTTYLTARLDYQFRRLGINAGFTRASQGITAIGVLPSTVNSYNFGIYRWFSLF